MSTSTSPLGLPTGTALITGASSGAGAEFARQLAARGYDLILVARREDKLSQLAEEISGSCQVTTTVVGADLAQDEDIT
ncbi:MAG: SDR family NAD(P)-dependent oxidoreductase, partial [Chloroflexota bacterium]